MSKENKKIISQLFCVIMKFSKSFLLKNTTYSSYKDYRRALLLAQLSLLDFCVVVFYIIVDSISYDYGGIVAYVIVCIACSIVFLINRAGHFKIANIIFLSSIVAVLYFFTSNDLYRNGTSNYLIFYTLMTLTLCGYEQIRLGLFFCALALVVFYLAYFVNSPAVIEHNPPPQSYINFSFFVNFIVAVVSCVLLVFFLLNVNNKIEKDLSLNNQLLIKTNKELDRFVYSASHDLQAPLSSMLGLIEVAQRSADPKEIQHCLSLMKVRIGDLNLFIKEIIDYSRNVKQEIRIENFNVYELVKEVVDGLKFGNGLDKITIRYFISNDLNVTSDRARIKVILSNLIGNAFKYKNIYNAEPTVIIRVGVVDHHLKIEIEDNGIGIEEKHLTKIFEMFYRASERSQGSGLGLYIVKETVDKLNGSINVKSVYGQGSVFSVEIPV